MSKAKTPAVGPSNQSEVDSSAYLDPEDLHVADSLHGSLSLYSSPTVDPEPGSQPGDQSYNPNQFNRAQSSFNNHLLHNHTDFNDIQTLDSMNGVPVSDDSSNWDETSQYRHDFKSYASRYIKETITIAALNIFAFFCFIFVIVSFAIDVYWIAIILLIVGILFAIAGIYFAFQFWQTYQRRTPFHFQLPWGH